MATIANGGTRHAVHLLDRVERTGETVFIQEPEIVSTLDFSGEIYDTILEGMLAVTEDGTASTVFSDYHISVLGKSGSAQVGTAGRTEFSFGRARRNRKLPLRLLWTRCGGQQRTRIARDILTAYFGEPTPLRPMIPVQHKERAAGPYAPVRSTSMKE